MVTYIQAFFMMTVKCCHMLSFWQFLLSWKMNPIIKFSYIFWFSFLYTFYENTLILIFLSGQYMTYLTFRPLQFLQHFIDFLIPIYKFFKDGENHSQQRCFCPFIWISVGCSSYILQYLCNSIKASADTETRTSITTTKMLNGFINSPTSSTCATHQYLLRSTNYQAPIMKVMVFWVVIWNTCILLHNYKALQPRRAWPEDSLP